MNREGHRGDAMSPAAAEIDKVKWSGGACALLIAAALLSGCDDHDDGCWNCRAPTPYESSLGLVAGNFNDNGHTSIIATSTVVYQPQFNAGNLKSYLSTGVGTFGAPTLTPAGN